ncbi:MAG: hypothetical protein LQ346_005680, partial [Caloplaca aetnensis]
VSSISKEEVVLLVEEVVGGDGGGIAWDEEGEFDGCPSCSSEALWLSSLPLAPTSWITNLAEPPAGTVTTQDTAPPAPLEPPPPTNSLTPCFDGLMAHGRPLQPSPSQTISMPKVGFSSRKGVAGSR